MLLPLPQIEDLERELVGKRDELDVFARREGELLPLRDQVAELKSSISARESQVLELERQLTVCSCVFLCF